MNRSSRPVSIYLLMIIEVAVGIAGAVSGLLMLIDPSGAMLGLSTALLSSAPVHEYLWPGLVLLYVLGLLPLAAARGLYSNETWALPLSIVLSMTLIGWIMLQIFFIGYTSPHHPILLGAGIVMLILCLRRSAWHYVVNP